MKKTVLILAVLFSLMACKEIGKKAAVTTDQLTDPASNPPVEDSTTFTSITWIDSTTRQLGKLVKDQEIEITWRFKNTGNKMLIIQHVSAGCGCTIPETPKEPFAPGQEGVIRAKFNGSGNGPVYKQVTVTANTLKSKIHNLAFSGEISGSN